MAAGGAAPLLRSSIAVIWLLYWQVIRLLYCALSAVFVVCLVVGWVRTEVLEQRRHLLDRSLRLGLTEGISARFDGRNLLDAGFEVRQGPAVRERYTPGRVFSLGLTWRQ